MKRLQERRLARLRGATDGDVARRGRDVDAPHFLAVPARLVHDAEPDPQRPALVVAGDELVDRRRIGQRRQPHPVGVVLAGGELIEDDLAQHLLFGLDRHDVTVASRIGAAVNRWMRMLLSALRARRQIAVAGRHRRRHVGVAGVDALELHRVLHADAQEADTALLVRDVLRLRRSDHRLGFRGTGGAQRDPVGEVGFQLVDAGAAGVQRLRGQQQVHPQRSTHAADPVEQRDEVRVVLQQFGELVDDDEQCRQRRQVGAAFAVLLVLGDTGERAGGADLHTGLPQDGLPAVEFTGEHLTHAADQFGFFLHVGDHRGGVRQLLHARGRSSRP